jgi:hypothetical protein
MIKAIPEDRKLPKMPHLQPSGAFNRALVVAMAAELPCLFEVLEKLGC